MNVQPWHNLTLAEVFKVLQSGKEGLTSIEAAKRLVKIGLNQLPREKKLTPWRIVFNQVKSPLVYILIISAAVSLVLGHSIDGSVILAIVVINTFIGFIQEYKANDAIERLRQLVHYQAKVWRSGKLIIIDTKDLVPGDVIDLEAGMKVPADCRLMSAVDLQVIEATLTGESEPAKKTAGVISIAAALTDRRNLVYLGTAITKGKGRAVVCGTGLNTELGKIASLVATTTEEPTPLQEKLAHLAHFISLGMVLVVALIFIFGILAKRDVMEMFLVSVAVAIAAIPEGLIVALTVVLVVGIQKILKKGSLVRRLVAAETLGGTTVICTDKTGTLTRGEMTVTNLLTFEKLIDLSKLEQPLPENISLAFQIGLLCNDSFIVPASKINPVDQLVGDSTDQALVLAGQKVGLSVADLKTEFPRLGEVPFTSEAMYAATLNQDFPQGQMLLVKGAPEIILNQSTLVLINQKQAKLTDQHRERLDQQIAKLTSRGLRLLAVAYRQYPQQQVSAEHLAAAVSELTLVGIFVLKDPLRADAKQTIDLCSQAGIRAILVTGDHPLTAMSIAQEAGIIKKTGEVLEGHDLDRLDDSELARVLKKVSVFARVEPRHKIRIVEALQQAGEVVAMTGDGVNDAPALKAADIGVALGSGTDVAKEAADVILLDDNLGILVAAVHGGRVIFDNIRKVLVFLLANSMTEMVLVVASLIFNLPLPLVAVQILWVNVVVDAFPAFALALDPEEPGIMREKPRARQAELLGRRLKTLIILIGAQISLSLLVIYYFVWRVGYNLETLRTIMFVALAVSNLLIIFSCRSWRTTFWHSLNNWYVNGALLLGLLMIIIAVYIPLLQKLFQTVSLSPLTWVFIISVSLLDLVLVEFYKMIFIFKNKTSSLDPNL